MAWRFAAIALVLAVSAAAIDEPLEFDYAAIAPGGAASECAIDVTLGRQGISPTAESVQAVYRHIEASPQLHAVAYPGSADGEVALCIETPDENVEAEFGALQAILPAAGNPAIGLRRRMPL